MSVLAETQRAFVEAVFDPDLPVPADWRCMGQSAPADRFAVYRNNVMVGLTEALRDAYPVVHRLVGDEFFAAMAGVFARAHPPRSPVMHEYGDGFAGFLAGFPPAASLPYLADVARLERAWVEAYHARDAVAVDANGATLQLHPATRLVRSSFPILTIWHVNQGDDEPAPLELSGESENVLVTRPATEVQACRIPDVAADLIEGVEVGASPGPLGAPHVSALCALGAFSQ